MTLCFLADEDVDEAIVQGLSLREPAIDLLDVKTSGLRGIADAALLELAHREGRVLITHDRRTMTRYFRERIDAGKPCSGVIVLSQRQSVIGEIIESLVLAWTASQAEEWQDRIVFLPFR